MLRLGSGLGINSPLTSTARAPNLWTLDGVQIANAGGSAGAVSGSTFSNGTVGTNGTHPRFRIKANLSTGVSYRLTMTISGDAAIDAVGGAAGANRVSVSGMEIDAIFTADNADLYLLTDGRALFSFDVVSAYLREA